MSLIVNGTTIPTNADAVKYGSTLIDNVNINGTNVWKKFKEINIGNSVFTSINVWWEGGDGYNWGESQRARISEYYDLTSGQHIYCELALTRHYYGIAFHSECCLINTAGTYYEIGTINCYVGYGGEAVGGSACPGGKPHPSSNTITIPYTGRYAIGLRVSTMGYYDERDYITMELRALKITS